jgi:hypothetical protein
MNARKAVLARRLEVMLGMVHRGLALGVAEEGVEHLRAIRILILPSAAGDCGNMLKGEENAHFLHLKARK